MPLPLPLPLSVFKKKPCAYDVTIFQTPRYGEKKGYKVVYRTELDGSNHQEVLKRAFSTFNVFDTVPNDYQARFMATGDVILIDEGKRGKTYYKLLSTGWSKINRLIVQAT
ncbi:YodL domain-containing protein [Bacillus atrophaeus]|uniref:YodL domain-containing protein n=1 Tax=Bacillus atrophaeus TaxID=1452 RepID=UPI001EFA873E|nr:YodL domain-containing protein [Bacillus atrophaeus]MCG8397274.1 YodL domain-containing protein [Bacillus atrophaeus]